jgi:epidermal growth factor receptor substrate 15
MVRPPTYSSPNALTHMFRNLADTQDRGFLDSTDFAIGMYLIQASMSGQLSAIPGSLPPGLYEQAAGVQQVSAHTTGTSGSFSPITGAFPQPQKRSSIVVQYTGQSQLSQPVTAPRLPSRTVPSAFGSSPFSSPPRNEYTSRWDVTAAEKASSDRFFDGLDTQKRGYIEGEVAVPFMLDSKLSGEDLAQIWQVLLYTTWSVGALGD